MQKLILSGNVGADATVNDLPNGKQVINFNLAVTEKYNDQTKTTWYKCALFRNDVRIAPYIKKGIKVLVIGKPDLETYISQNGEHKANLKCLVSEIELLSHAENKQEEQQNQEPKSNNAVKPDSNTFQEEDDSNLPF